MYERFESLIVQLSNEIQRGFQIGCADLFFYHPLMDRDIFKIWNLKKQSQKQKGS